MLPKYPKVAAQHIRESVAIHTNATSPSLIYILINQFRKLIDKIDTVQFILIIRSIDINKKAQVPL